MEIKAYAKINIGLDVVRRREDGYHEVKMIMQNIGLHDLVDVKKVDAPGIHINVGDADLPVDKDNLIYKAAKLLIDEFDIKDGVSVNLTKNIPIAAGLAGGSTDAAATMIGINDVFGLGLSKEDLMTRGVKIGADVPYCILGGTAIAEGIGEKLTRITACPDCTILIAKPEAGVSTKHVYQSLEIDKVTHPDIDTIIDGINKGDISQICDNLGNVLESVTIKEHPVIDRIKQMMIDGGAVGSLMSGSGPTVFGIFADSDKAAGCLEKIREANIAKDILITNVVNP